ncbi:HAMP domain-containing protein [bacterium]|nr:HAMP domain-containing protein [bacterium]
MKRSLFLKVFGGYLLIVISLAAFFLFFTFQSTQNFYHTTLSHHLENLGTTLKGEIKPLLEKENLAQLDSFVKNLGNQINTRITVIDVQGKVLADSEENPQLMENHKFRPEILRALEGYTGQTLRFSKTLQEKMLYIGLPLKENGEIKGVLRLSLFVKDINRLFFNLRTEIAWIAGIILILSLVGAFFLSRNLIRPIHKLTSASRRLAEGDYKTKVFLKNRDNLKELADSFNNMADRIHYSFAQISYQKEKLNGIVSSIQDGLVTMDQEGKIIHQNKRFREIVQSTEIKDKHYWELIREPGFGRMMTRVRKEHTEISEEITLNNRIYLCKATFLKSWNEIMVTFHDITQIRNVEQIKKDFVVNVSHELRTPLTAIKGYVETLEEEADEKNRYYFNIIKKHTDRLINIVNDLLSLSELEEKEIEMETKKINIRDLIDNVVKIYNHKVSKKDIQVKNQIKPEFPPVKGDAFRLEQLFLNLMDNAVKYTEKGQISFQAYQKNNQAYIQIQDSGIGIPSQALSRIFERFYVVDKSRSRKMGGTGLGLSIVKHIVRLHNGDITVKSTPGEGTQFTVSLPFSS